MKQRQNLLWRDAINWQSEGPRYIIVKSLVSLILAGSTSMSAERDDVDFCIDLEKAVTASRSPEELHQAYRTCFGNLNADDLDSMRFHADRGIALQSAWELVRRESRDRAESIQQDQILIDQTQLQRFLGYVEGRLKVRMPLWWKDGLSDAKLHSVSRSVTPYAQNRDRNAANPHIHVDQKYWVPRGTTFVEQVRPRYQLVGEQGRIIIPETLLAPLLTKEAWLDHVYVDAAVSSESRNVIALHGPFPQRYHIYLASTSGDQIVWKSAVWTECIVVPGGTGSIPRHWSSLLLQEGEVIVVGLCEYSAYIESFSLVDGENAFRFSTSY